MPATKSTSEIASKWKRVTPGRTEDYVQGISNPRVDWKTATEKAEDNWKAGVTEAATKKRFAKGVSKAGTGKWQSNALQKQGRWGEGVAIGADAYEAGISPYIAVINSTDIGPRFPKGSPQNYERSRKLGEALHKKKMSG